MEIQKQREAFEKFIANKYKDLIDQRLCINSDGDYMAWDMQVAWATWQAAQAAPEGFVLVPMQPTPRMIDATWNCDEEIQNMSHNSRNEFIYKAMIEAQEQIHE